MNDQQLRRALESIGRRDRQLVVRWVLAALWLSLALVVIAAVARGRGAGVAVGLLVLPLLAVIVFALPYLLAHLRAARDTVGLLPRPVPANCGSPKNGLGTSWLQNVGLPPSSGSQVWRKAKLY